MSRTSKRPTTPNSTAHPSKSGSPPSTNRAEPKAPARKRRTSRIELNAASAVEQSPERRQPRKSNTSASTGTKHPRVSALDAAAKVLTGLSGDEAKHGITAQDLIERMAQQKLWTSPGGKTPQATLYAAMVREITGKGAAARFRKVSKGHFAASPSAGKPISQRKPKA